MFIEFLGKILHTIYRTIILKQKVYFSLIWDQIDQIGLRAIPIIMLLNFLVGVVLTHQGINTLKDYGQLDKIPDIIVPVYVRYVGCLITSLIVAGRSGSAFTSEIGSMKLNQEIDALNSMNISSTALITIPRLFVTSFMMPVLVILAIVSGLLGSIFISWYLIDFPPDLFIENIRNLTKLLTLNLTLLKSFIFGMIISTIGAYRGFCVYSNAQILGEMTTKSVVECIFWVIVIDGCISTYYSYLDL